MQCPACDQPGPTDASYCARCGAALPRSASRRRSRHARGTTGSIGEPSAPEGERRQLTVMFCELVDSSALAERLEPEHLRELLSAHHAVCTQVVEKYEGYVAQYLGDGLLVYFSYPQAHEDDAERAVRAGLGIVETLEEIEHPSGRLQVRVAIHTGRVVVSDLGDRRAIAMGHPLNLAARLEAAAAVGSVVMSGQTERLVRGLFETEDLGEFDLRGIAEPVRIHRVWGPSGAAGRLDRAAEAGLTPLTGREGDMALLVARWERARRGAGQVVLLSGEPGIGKSRLVRALRERLEGQRHTWLECRSSAHHLHSAFHPVVGLLRERFPDAGSGAPEQRRAVLAAAADAAGMPREALVPVLARLLSVPPPDGDAPAEALPGLWRQQALEAIADWLVRLARQRPVVLVVEDLHWADPSTLELLGSLVGTLEAAPVLLLATTRTGTAPAWPPAPHLTHQVVPPLTPPEAAVLAERVAGERALSPTTLEQIVSKTDGVPLFVEELTRSVLESGASGGLAIPATLQDLLMERLDRLGASKEVAQLGAVLGREFSREEIAAVSTLDAVELERSLERLTAAALLSRRGDASYCFNHVLVQEAAEQSLLRDTRRAWHARAARVIEQRFPSRAEAEPETLARHCEAGGLVEKAIAYHQSAADLASDRSGSVEAIEHLRRGLTLLATLPVGPERRRRELDLLTALGAAWATSQGWGSVEAEQAFERARQLCEELGETPALFPVIRGLLTFFAARADLDTATELCGRLLRLAESDSDPSRRVIAHHQTGIVHCFRGDQAEALIHFREALAHQDAAASTHLATVYQAHPAVLVRTWMAWPLWMAGFPDQALQRCAEALAIARDSRHPFGLAQAHAALALVHLWRRERDASQEHARRGIEIARLRGFSALLGGCSCTLSIGRIHRGAAAAEIDDALAELRRAAELLMSVGSNGSIRPTVLGQLAEALAGVGRAEPARAAVAQALEFSQQSGARFWDAELHRVGAGLLALEGADRGDVERELGRALEISRRQHARTLELRAAAALVRLRGSAADRAGLRALVAGFAEGGPDLVAARELLAADAPRAEGGPLPG